MFDRGIRTKFNHLVLIIMFLLVVGGMSACRTRSVPGSVTPDADAASPVPIETNTPASYPEPDEPEPLSPTPTVTSDMGSEPVEDTPFPQETVTAEATPVATQPTPLTETQVPSEAEEGTATPIATSIPSTGFTPGSTIQHIVGQREWLLQIARCYGTSYGAIQAANRLPNPDYILPGANLAVPAIGTTGPIIGPPCVIPYTVQPGDTWESLAQQFGTTVTILQRANPGNLIAGNQIWVPRSN
jgi:LysM repeat protein